MYVTVVVLAGPYEPSVPLQSGCDHVVDQPVFVGQSQRIHTLLVIGAVDLLENILEPAVVFFQNRVLRTQIERPFFVQRHVETSVGKTADRSIRIVHAESYSVSLVVIYLPRLGGSVLTGEGHGQFSGAVRNHVRSPILIAECVTADADRLGPAGNQPGNVPADDGFAEDRAVQNVPDRTVR